MICQHCNAVNPDGSRFCKSCGKMLNTDSDDDVTVIMSASALKAAQSVQPSINCPACAKPNALGAKFCKFCGANMQPSAQTNAADPLGLLDPLAALDTPAPAVSASTPRPTQQLVELNFSDDATLPGGVPAAALATAAITASPLFPASSPSPASAPAPTPTPAPYEPPQAAQGTKIPWHLIGIATVVVAAGSWLWFSKGRSLTKGPEPAVTTLPAPAAAPTPVEPASAPVAVPTAPMPIPAPAPTAEATPAAPPAPVAAPPAIPAPPPAAVITETKEEAAGKSPASAAAAAAATTAPKPAASPASRPATPRPAASRPAAASVTAAPPPAPTPAPAAPAPAPAAAPVAVPAPAPAAPAGPASPREACGSRVFLALTNCIQEQCSSARFSRHPQCVELREQQRQRDEAGQMRN
jgi:hypothetical protein